MCSSVVSRLLVLSCLWKVSFCLWLFCVSFCRLCLSLSSFHKSALLTLTPETWILTQDIYRLNSLHTHGVSRPFHSGSTFSSKCFQGCSWRIWMPAAALNGKQQIHHSQCIYVAGSDSQTASTKLPSLQMSLLPLKHMTAKLLGSGETWLSQNMSESMCRCCEGGWLCVGVLNTKLLSSEKSNTLYSFV